MTLNLGNQNLANNNSQTMGLLYDGGSNGYSYTISNGVFSQTQEKIVQVAAGTLTISANLYAGGGAFDKAGVGTLILSGNNTAFTGGFNVNWGTLQAGSVTAFTPNSSVAVGQAGTLALNGYNNNVSSIIGMGQVVNGSSSSPATLTIGAQPPIRRPT